MDSVRGRVSPVLRRTSILPLLLASSLLILGCGGGGTYTVDEGQMAQRFIPSEQSVDHHPDSLEALTIREENDKIQYQLDGDYQSLLEKWSSRFRNIGAGRSIRSRTYATFQSLELALASLQPEMGVLSLREERARSLIEKRRERYFDTIQINVYWFIERRGDSGIIAGPSARTELQVGGATYRPLRTDHGPLREAFVSGGKTVLYRRNTLYFPRMTDGTDVLKNASGVQLDVRRVGTQSEEQFAWRWASDPSV